MSCIFCDIINKREKAYIVYEDEHVCCFLDKDPINKGHVLVVPKEHYSEFTEVQPEYLEKIIVISQKIALALEELLNTDGITIMQNNGVFKDVDHYHMHIVPRFLNDGFLWVEPDINIHEEEFHELQLSFNRIFNR